jgi:hypothetical protein
MKTTRIRSLIAAALVCALTLATGLARAADAQPSWNDGAAIKSIVAFVAKVTTQGSPAFVPPAERIAVFDNDGTLWAEQS